MRQKGSNLYQRGPVWWCWFYDHEGRRVQKSTHQRDRALAGQAARRIEREHLAAPTSQAPVTDLVAAYLANCERKSRAASTLSFYLAKAKPLVEFFGDRDANRLELADTEDYMDARLMNARVHLPTVAKELGLLRAALRYARKHKRYTGDVSAIIPDDIQGAYVPRDRALSHPEYEALKLTLNPDRRDYLAAWCYTGQRESELYAFTPADLAGDMLHVNGSKTDGSDRWLPVAAEVADVFGRRESFPRWGNVRRDLAAACMRAEIKRVSCNDLRRTFCTWLAEAGVPEAVAASLLGHASSTMVRRVYTRIGRAAQIAAVATLPSLAVAEGVADKVAPGGNSGSYGNQETGESREVPVPRAGIEPATRGFSVRVSTPEIRKGYAGYLKLVKSL